jgi:tetratricopeptide (TPR) repeat protein
MKVSQQKRSRWVYIGLSLMLFALLSFSFLPLVSSMLQSNPSLRGNSTAAVEGFSGEQSKLEIEASGYQVVLEREPDNQNALRGLLNVRLRQGDLNAAIEPLERLAQLNSQEPEYMLLLAQAKQQIQDFDGAASTYRTILASSPNEMRALKGLTDLLVQQNRSTEAIGLVQSKLNIALSAKSEVALVTSLQLLLGEIYVAQNLDSQALAVYEQAFQGNPEDFRPLLAKALVLQKQGKMTEAEPVFQQAIALAPVEYKDQIKVLATRPPEASMLKNKE